MTFGGGGAKQVRNIHASPGPTSLGSERAREVDDRGPTGGKPARHRRHHQEEHRRQRQDRRVRWAHLEEQCCEKSCQHHRAREPDRVPSVATARPSRAVLEAEIHKPATCHSLRFTSSPPTFSRMATTSVRSRNYSANVSPTMSYWHVLNRGGPWREKPTRPPQLMPVGESFTMTERFFKVLLIYTESTRKLASEGPCFVGSKPIPHRDLKTRVRRYRPGYMVFPATHQNYKADAPWNLRISVRPNRCHDVTSSTEDRR